MKSVVWLAISLLVISCSQANNTVRPVPEKDRQASFDGNHQDSGILEAGDFGFLVTSLVVERYKALVAVYGKEADFLPPLDPAAGITPADAATHQRHPDRGALFLMTKQVMVNFIKMNQWRKMGRLPEAQKARPGLGSRVIEAITA